MTSFQSNANNPPLSDEFLRAQPEIVYKVEGRILRTTAIGPFNDQLVSAIPHIITDLIVKLAQQGKWGQIVTFERDAYASATAFAEFTLHLKARYRDPYTNPVTALVFAGDVKNTQLMAARFHACYHEAGVECCLFEDYASAHYWVKYKIRQTSELIAWKDSYKIGDTLIDDQHQELFLRAADVIAATNRETQTLCALRLYQYARAHFSHEESLMQRLHYPDMAQHLKQHEMLINRLNEFCRNIAKDNLIKADLEDFIAHWLLNHIAAVDSQLAAYVHQPTLP